MYHFQEFWQTRKPDFQSCKVVVFRNILQCVYFHEVTQYDIVSPDDLLGLQTQIQLLDSNTKAFLSGKKASNALLWGARGCGKSSVVKAVLGKYIRQDSEIKSENALRIIEIDSKDIGVLPLLLDYLRNLREYFFIIFCDDLTFHNNEMSYRSLKSILEGSFEAKPQNVLFYVTSNLRHIIQEDEQINALHAQDSIHETLSFSDRFPLSIGFYPISQNEYLAILRSLIQTHISQNTPNACDRESQIDDIMDTLRQKAINFATQIGNRSPRTAKDFFTFYCNQIFQ